MHVSFRCMFATIVWVQVVANTTQIPIMYVNVNVYVLSYICTYIRTCMFIYMLYIYMYICAYVHIHTCVYTGKHARKQPQRKRRPSTCCSAASTARPAKKNHFGAYLRVCVTCVSFRVCLCLWECAYRYIQICGFVCGSHICGSQCVVRRWVFHANWVSASYNFGAYLRVCVTRVSFCVCLYIHSHIIGCVWISASVCTGWRRPSGCLTVGMSFRKRATEYRALLQKLT